MSIEKLVKKTKVCHLSSAHPRQDIRIYFKEITSLKKAGFNVSFIVADGKGNDKDNAIIDVGKENHRLKRILLSTRKVYKKAKTMDVEIFHFHDPELIPIGLKLKRRGKKVIFDVHEDVTKQIISKPYLGRFTLKIISKIFSYYEAFACKRFDMLITVTQTIKNKLQKINTNTIVINNYPLLNEVAKLKRDKKDNDNVCYIGSISAIRGVSQVIQSLAYIDDVKLQLAGKYNDKGLEQKFSAIPSWDKVIYYGNVNREIVYEIMNNSIAGIVTFLPQPNHVEAQPNKMFEYMSAAIPVIASNYPLWKEIIEKNNCGICVNPENPEEIASAIKYLKRNPDKRTEMGNNGLKAILEKYNWANEEKCLIENYKKLLIDE